MSWSTSDRRARLPANWFSTVRPYILKRDPTCKLSYSMCTVKSTQVDHIQRDDDHSYNKLQGVCRECHAHKSAKEGRSAQLTRREKRKRPTEKHPESKT